MELAVQDYVMKNRDLFESVQNVKNNISGTPRAGEHTILNYNKILDEMIKYLHGFHDYKTSGNQQYKHKVIKSTYAFYNNMFDHTNKKYRKKIILSEFPNINYQFIAKSKDLNHVIRKMKSSVDNEVLNLARITEGQYKKLAKVNKDDMNIYLWLVQNASISAELRSFYQDDSTPVMHKIKK